MIWIVDTNELEILVKKLAIQDRKGASKEYGCATREHRG